MLRYLPWKFIVQRAARAYGFADPALWLARIRNFAQPSEVQEPIELVRAGVLFHARGIVNAKAIQHNLDWVWPYWVERQFDPEDISFNPRAFSSTGGSLVVAIRPYNPEGVQFIDEVESLEGKDGWFVNSRTEVLLDRPADEVLVSDYASGDVFMRLMTVGPPSRGGPGAARLATATGQWPEAIHPQTLGGCMGDGQHGWAAAEWVMMIRNCFVREEGERLIVGSGLFAEWFDNTVTVRADADAMGRRHDPHPAAAFGTNPGN